MNHTALRENQHINLCIFGVYVWTLNIPVDVISVLEGDTGADIRSTAAPGLKMDL